MTIISHFQSKRCWSHAKLDNRHDRDQDDPREKDNCTDMIIILFLSHFKIISFVVSSEHHIFNQTFGIRIQN